MFKNIFKVLVSVMILVCVVNADSIDLNGNVKGVDVTLKSANDLVTGSNDFFVTLSKDGKDISDAKVKIKFFMPEMPGMPYMEYKSKAKFVDGKYKLNGNFAMGGTWQYHLLFKTKDGKKYKIRGSVNL